MYVIRWSVNCNVLFLLPQVDLVFTTEGGEKVTMKVFDFKNDGGVTMAMYNTGASIRDFAHSCFQVLHCVGYYINLVIVTVRCDLCVYSEAKT